MAAIVELTSQEMAFVDRLVDGIFKTHQTITGGRFYAYQTIFCKRIIESVLINDGATITGLWSRQSGKTTAVAELIITLAIILPVLANAYPNVRILQPYKDGLRIGIFAPIEHQAQLSFRKMRKIAHSDLCKEFCEEEDINVAIETSRGDTLSFSNGSVIWARTASPNSKVEGETFHVILIDEAQDVDRFKVDKEIEPMRAATHGTLVKIGTANVSRGGFHTDIEYNIERRKLGLAPRNHFQFDYKIVTAERRAAYKRDGNIQHLRYEAYVEDQKRKSGGERSRAFRMNFMLMWQESNSNAISARALLTAKDMTRELNVSRLYKDEDFTLHRWRRVGGLDIAKTSDSTVATVVEFDELNPIMVRDWKTGEIVKYYPKVIIATKALQGNFEDVQGVAHGQYTEIVKFFREWHADTVTVDATTMGDPVFERLQVLAPEIDWRPFKFNMITKQNVYRHYVDEWEAGRVKIASAGKSEDSHEWIGFFQEHRNLERTQRGNYTDYHAPRPKAGKQQPEEEEYHDDYPDSGALAAWTVKNYLLQEVRVDRPGSRPHTKSSNSRVSVGSTLPTIPTSGQPREHRYRRRW